MTDQTSRPAAPVSETPETEGFLQTNPLAFDRAINFARSLERRLSLAQTEIKGHMRNEGDLLNELALARADWACTQTRIAELEKAATAMCYSYTDHADRCRVCTVNWQNLKAALKSRA